MIKLEEHLIAFWEDFCDAEGIECMSADELLLVSQLDSDSFTLTARQEKVVRAFIEIWEETV